MADTVARTANEQAELVARELFQTPEGRADPYPRYRALRSLDPVHYSETAQGWLLTRYDDCHAALRDPRLLRGYAKSMDARRPNWRDRPALARGEHSMLNMDGPDHTRLRKLVAKAFTPRTIERLRPRIEAMVDELLDPLADAGRGDLMTDLAFPLPVRVIGELLGVPEEDRPPFRERVRRVTVIFEVTSTAEDLDAADEAARESDAYFTDLIAAVRADPGDNLLSDLVAVDDSGDRLSDTELRLLASLLFAAGFETTTNLVGNGALALLRHPDQLQLLRQQPELFANLPDELLRYDGSIQMTARITAEPVEVGGTVLGEGEPVFALLGAANRDPEHFTDPDRFDVTRTDVRPLTFGGGVHFCLGAALARVETEIVFRKLLERFGDIELDGMVAVRDRLTFRGPASVPLALVGRRPQPRPAPAPTMALGMRPPDDDTSWRAAFREHVETAPRPSAEELAGRVALLARVPVLRLFTVSELEELAATAYPIAFETGQVLCAEGADAPECYVIASGEAAATSEGAALATIGANDVVGERGPLLGAPRAATVTATSHLLTYAISRDRLQRLMQQRPGVATAIRNELEGRYGTVGD